LVNPVSCPIDNEFTMFTGIYVHAVLVIELINSDDICEKSLKLIPSLFYHNENINNEIKLNKFNVTN
jgi:hypothetical protein